MSTAALHRRLRRSRVTVDMADRLDRALQRVLCAAVIAAAMSAFVLAYLTLTGVPGAMKIYTGALALGGAALSVYLAAGLYADTLRRNKRHPR